MPTTLAYSDYAPLTADGMTKASILPAFTGQTALPAGACGILRFATGYSPSGANTVADLFMVGGLNNPRQWQVVSYTATGTVLSAANLMPYCDASPLTSSGEIVASIGSTWTGGGQGSYNGSWIRFATAYTPSTGVNVADLVMTGGRHDTDRWQLILYTFTAGVLS